MTLNRVEAYAQELRRFEKEVPKAEELQKWRIDRIALKREIEVQKHDRSLEGLGSRACL